jgi:hypothetical protein
MARHIRCLIVYSERAISVITANNVSMILIHAINLRRLELAGPLAPTIVMATSQACAVHLRSLHLRLNDEHSLSALVYLTFFVGLHSLSLTISGTLKRDTALSIMGGLPWDMPHLVSFSLSADRECTTQLAFILCKCSFPNLQAVNLRVDIADGTTCGHLAELCSLWSLQHFGLFLDASQSEYYTILIPRITAASLRVPDFHPSLGNNIPRMIETLIVNTPTSLEAYANIWNVFDTLLERKTCMRNIHIARDKKYVDWMEGTFPGQPNYVDDAIKEKCFPRLLRYSILLHGAGIHLRDSNGKTVLDYHDEVASRSIK